MTSICLPKSVDLNNCLKDLTSINKIGPEIKKNGMMSQFSIMNQ